MHGSVHMVLQEFSASRVGASLDSWAASHEAHFSARSRAARARKPLGDYERRRQQIIDEHLERYREVRAYFADRKDDLLIMSITAGEGWEKLCPFLGMPIPEVPFPRVNRVGGAWQQAFRRVKRAAKASRGRRR